MQTQKDKIAKATKFEPKIDDTSRQDKLAQSNEEAEALEYSKTLAQIPENLKKRRIYRLIRFTFANFRQLLLSALIATMLFTRICR